MKQKCNDSNFQCWFVKAIMTSLSNMKFYPRMYSCVTEYSQVKVKDDKTEVGGYWIFKSRGGPKRLGKITFFDECRESEQHFLRTKNFWMRSNVTLIFDEFSSLLVRSPHTVEDKLSTEREGIDQERRLVQKISTTLCQTHTTG